MCSPTTIARDCSDDIPALPEGGRVITYDEFLEHIGLMNYPNWLVKKARNGLARAVELYESREFPFSDLS